MIDIKIGYSIDSLTSEEAENIRVSCDKPYVPHKYTTVRLHVEVRLSAEGVRKYQE